MLPGILSQLGSESISSLKRMATSLSGAGEQKASTAQGEDDDDDVPGTNPNHPHESFRGCLFSIKDSTVVKNLVLRFSNTTAVENVFVSIPELVENFDVASKGEVK